MKAQIVLNQQEVEEIVLEHLLKKFKVVNSVKIKVGEGWVGHGPNEMRTTIFKGIECDVEIE